MVITTINDEIQLLSDKLDDINDLLLHHINRLSIKIIDIEKRIKILEKHKPYYTNQREK